VLFKVGILVDRAEKDLEDPKVRSKVQLQFQSALQELCAPLPDRRKLAE
jgi:hypothetical protein